MLKPAFREMALFDNRESRQNFAAKVFFETYREFFDAAFQLTENEAKAHARDYRTWRTGEGVRRAP